MIMQQPTKAAIPTHRICGICNETLPRHLFRKKEYLQKESNPTCHGCKRRQTAERMKQCPPQPPKQGRVADSGQIRRPNNFGYCNYIDMLFGMNCFHDIVALGAFGSAKDVSESVAAILAATRHADIDIDDANATNSIDALKGSDVLCLCIGDGTTPRTAVLASYMKKWTCISIDPALWEEWRGECPKDVQGLYGFGGTLIEFMGTSTFPPNNLSHSYRHLILLCVHSHARFVGPVTIEHIRERYGNIPTTVVSLPCCPKFRHKGDIGREPDAHYEDDCVFSACRKVEVWNFAAGCYEESQMLLRREATPPTDNSILLRSPSDLTPSVVVEMLQSCPLYSQCFQHDNNNDVVTSISVSDVDEGVLSHVVNVSVTYAQSVHSESLPAGLIIKFPRPEAPQQRMFTTEGSFYSSRYDTLRSKQVPFGIPNAIYISPECIALERIDVESSTGTMKLVDGCSNIQDAETCVVLLATMHAKCWIDDTADEEEEVYATLDPTPGVGLAMPALTKERLFTVRWEEYLDLYASSDSKENVITNEKEQAELRTLCENLAKAQLREIHDRVTTFQPTLIHGDFHVANLLFTGGNNDTTTPPTLIDWATCGRGNPLFDLCFFLLVSTPRGGEDEEYTSGLLRLYYSTLIGEDTSENSSSILQALSTEKEFLDLYRICLLNEFLILVVYDRLARQFVEAAETPTKKEERAQHFHNVARRCMKALLGNLPRFDLPPLKSEQDLREEAEALTKGENVKAEL